MEQRNELNAAPRSFIFNRVLLTTPDVAFSAWTDEAQVANWWGPKDFTNPVCELDVRPGGIIRIDMKGADGILYPMQGTFHEVTNPETLVFTSTAFLDEQGNPGLEILNNVTFGDVNGKTKLRLQSDVIKVSPEAEEALKGMEDGWNQSLFKLEEHIAKIEEAKKEK